MKSGEPEAAEDLSLLIHKKRHSPPITCEIVSDSARWFKSQLVGADIRFNYQACDDNDYSAYAAFTLIRQSGKVQLLMDIKIAEIGGKPYAFANVGTIGKGAVSGFPFLQEISDEDGKNCFLNYVSDFILCTAPLD